MNSNLVNRHCEACEGIGTALTPSQITHLMPQLSDSWHILDEHTRIMRAYSFNNFYETMAFVNALAWIAHQDNHHPDLEIGYNYCRVSYSTHALKGLSHNDFICAAKLDALINLE